MQTLLQKVSYFMSSAFRYHEPLVCPSCGGKKVKLIDRKMLVTRLFDCESCRLYFRHPVEKPQTNFKFYQKQYIEEDDITTKFPSDEELQRLIANSFDTEANRSASRLLDLFGAILPSLQGVKIVDYGCSWGYISYQFKQAGMGVQSFELSLPRARFGAKKLGLDIHTSYDELEDENDIFFSSHVIEHVPSVKKMIESGQRLLRKNGFFISVCPNGSPEYRQADEEGFHRMWGKVHPNCLNKKFFQNAFRDHPHYITSSPFDVTELKVWDQQSQKIGKMDGPEILVVAKL